MTPANNILPPYALVVTSDVANDALTSGVPTLFASRFALLFLSDAACFSFAVRSFLACVQRFQPMARKAAQAGPMISWMHSSETHGKEGDAGSGSIEGQHKSH